MHVRWRWPAITTLVLIAGALSPGVSSSAADIHLPSTFSFGAASSTPGNPYPLGSPSGVAVDDDTGDVYVADSSNAWIEKFDSSGSLLLIIGDEVNASTSGDVCVIASGDTCQSGTVGTGPGAFTTPAFLAVDNSGGPSNGDLYVGDTGSNLVSKFEADGALITGWATGGQLSGSGIEPFGPLAGVAVDGGGILYVYETEPEPRLIFRFGEAGGFVESLETPFGTAPAGIAVDSVGDIYKVRGSLQPAKLDPTGTVLEGFEEIGCECAIGLAVDGSNDDLYVARANEVAHYNSSGTQLELFGSITEIANAAGVAIDPGTGKVYVTTITGRVVVFAPPPLVPPTVVSTSTGNVTAQSADLEARVNPNFFDTQYFFEYVSQAQFDATGFLGASQTPVGSLGAGSGLGTVRANIQALTPDTPYRFRVVVDNGNGGPVLGGDSPFTTFPLFAPGLPDSRQYEMISPPAKLGEVFPPEPTRSLGGSCGSCLPGFDSEKMPMQSAVGGASVVYEGQPFFGGLAAGPNEYLSTRQSTGWDVTGLSSPVSGGIAPQGFKAFSPDLSRGIVLQIAPTFSASAPPGYANLYLWEGTNSLTPLVTDTPQNRSPGVPVAGENQFNITFAGANAGTATSQAVGRVVFEANDALTGASAFAPAAPEVGANEMDLYEWTDGDLKLVNVLPGNLAAVPGAVVGSGLLNAPNGAQEGPNFDHAISADGSRIFWSEELSGQVYVRIDGEKTAKLKDPGTFLTASANGERALLSDGCVYSLQAEGCTNLTAGKGGLKGILGASDDLSRIYFIATAALAAGAEPVSCERPPPGSLEREEEEEGKASPGFGCNLYLFEDPEGPSEEPETTFIGKVLPIDDASLLGLWHNSPGTRTAQVSPDGRYLAFMSAARLTGFNNTIRGGGDRCGRAFSITPACAEVFEYDADLSNLSCASCNPTQQQPLGQSNLSLVVPGNRVLPQPLNLSPVGGGRLFFESQDALSPRDTNGEIQDVYEWEPQGVGSCIRPGGCVSLISTGHSRTDSMFLNATPSGDDAFFVTREQILPRDRDDLLDLYDARVGGGLEEGLGAFPCSGEGCKGPVSSPPAARTPGSSSFQGPGNPRASRRNCRSGYVKRHGRCVKKAPKKKRDQHRRSAKHDGRRSK